jgi:hypothetical protein
VPKSSVTGGCHVAMQNAILKHGLAKLRGGAKNVRYLFLNAYDPLFKLL